MLCLNGGRVWVINKESMMNEVVSKEENKGDNLIIENESWWTTGMYIGGMITIFPISNIVIPLIIWLLKKDESSAIKKHGINVLNFQITVSIALFLALGLGAATFFLFFTIPLAGVVIYAIKVAEVVLSVIAGVKAYKGEYFELPCKFRFLKDN